VQIKDGQVRRERRKEVTRMTYTQIETRLTCVDGVHMRRFADGYGASVARRAHSNSGHYGLFELAVLTPGECAAHGVPVDEGGL
jgi:hypothetical protein